MPSPPPATGTLSDISPVRLYFLAAGGDQTGLLKLQLADRLIQLQFRRGNLEHVSSSHPEDSLASFFRAQKLIGDEQLALAEESVPKFGGDLVAALFGLGVLNPANAFAHLTNQAMSLLPKVLLADTGSFSFESGAVPHKVMPLGNRWTVLVDAVRRMPAPDIKLRLRDQFELAIVKRNGDVPIKVLPLTPQEVRAASRIDGTRSLAQLAGDFPQDADNLLRLAFLLRELELVTLRDAIPPRTAVNPEPAGASAPSRPVVRADPPPRGNPPRLQLSVANPPSPPADPKPAAAKPPPQAPVSLEKELAELRAKASRLKEENYFQILGVSEKADGPAIKLAYIKMAKVYHPDTITSMQTSPELAKLKEDIFTAVVEAFRVLSDPKSRANYEEILKSGESDELLPLAQVLLAEEKFQRGCNLVKAKRFPDAVKMLDEAIDSHPAEGEFYAWRGYAKFFVLQAQDKRRAQVEAQKDLQLALQKNKFCAPAHYFLGQIAKLNGDKKIALTHFRRTVELKPDHIDAKREVRLLSGNK